jgi:hypothetical protein
MLESLFGGGDTSGGSSSIAAGVDPEAARLAGEYQARAAQAAAEVARKSVQDAISALTKQFNVGRADLAPYRTTGVQALDQLNQYIGLDPYNPGKAPTAPLTPAQKVAQGKAISDNDINNYIQQNSFVNKALGNGLTYTGVGSYDTGNKNGKGTSGFYDTYSTGLFTNVQADQKIRDAVKQHLGDQYVTDNADQYSVDQEQYQTDLSEYQKNLDWYNKYKTEGPKTAAQIEADVTSQPGYQAQLSQGVEAINRSASSRGLLKSGAVLKGLADYGANLESTYYGNMLSRLAASAGVGANAASQSSQQSNNLGSGIASLNQGLGDSIGNSYLAGGQAKAQSLISANPTYTSVGGSSGGDSGLSGIGSVLGGLGSIASGGGFGAIFRSSKTLKNKKKKIDFNTVLDSLDKLPVEEWHYKKDTNIEANPVKHIGPYAEDFKKVFNVGDGKTISVIDGLGVLFGLVKALDSKIKRVA